MKEAKRDYIEITNSNNESRKVEVVTIFQKEGTEDNYIIYKEQDNSHYYLAKYKGENIVNLETDMTEEEYQYANLIFKGVIENDIRN